jgi:hypothetical protein
VVIFYVKLQFLVVGLVYILVLNLYLLNLLV